MSKKNKTGHFIVGCFLRNNALWKEFKQQTCSAGGSYPGLILIFWVYETVIVFLHITGLTDFSNFMLLEIYRSLFMSLLLNNKLVKEF